MFNNKGQSLILFVLILPILMLALVLVVDVGKIVVLKSELNNISDIVLDYGLSNLDNENIKDELINLVTLNKNDIDKVVINIEDEKIYIELTEKSDGIFSSFIDLPVFNVRSSSVGYIENDKKRIERMGD